VPAGAHADRDRVVGAAAGRVGARLRPDDQKDRPLGYGVQRIVQTVRETDSLPGGTVVSVQTQTVRFARGQRHTTAVFRGRVVGGTGRYVHARGAVSGGRPGFDERARWRVTIRLR
jgi:hypothetical protein